MIIPTLSDGSMLDVIDQALREDIGMGDITTDSIIPSDLQGSGVFLGKANGVLSGLDVAAAVLARVDRALAVDALITNGMPVLRGMRIATVRGSIASMLKAERVALNFLQRMSGIATATAGYRKLVGDLPVHIMDTRKTVPCLRAFDRQAVRDGRGTNHRFGLDDMVLIKDNHIAASGSLTEAVHLVRARLKPGRPVLVEVEAGTLEQALEAANCEGVDIILLDNFAIDDLETAVRLVRRRNAAVQLEASGNVNESTVRAVAETGVDRISIGALTHSVKALDISFDITLPE